MLSLCVPFANESELLRRTVGQLRLEGERLQIEYQTSDNIAHILKSAICELIVPVSEIEEAEFKSNWFGLSNVLVIKTRSMKTVAEFPGSERATISFEIARADRTRAAELASHLRLSVTELALLRVDHANP